MSVRVVLKDLFVVHNAMLGLLLFCLVLPCSALEVPPLENEDCRICHTVEVKAIETAGGRHRDAVTCIDCHREHPPRGINAIPACSLCHATVAKAHYSVGDCMGCHPPHTPRKIAITTVSRVAVVCGSCHTGQAEEMFSYPSNHSVLDCKDCHQTHGEFLTCGECHEPHLESQTYSNCRQCHQPHSPLKVVYLNGLGNEHCVACHGQVGERLQQTTTKHRLLLCVYCHKSQHRRIPECETCHFRPHTSVIHEKYPDCASCHGGPHKLVN